MTFIIKWLMGAAGPYIIAAVAASLLALGALAGYEAYQAVQTQAAFDKHLAEDATKAVKASEDNRAAEAAHAQELTALRDQYQEKLDHDKEAADATIAGLRAGTFKLRNRFLCGSPRAAPAAAAGRSDDPPQGGLQREDAEDLVRVAADADIVARRLEYAQSVIDGQVKTCNAGR